ncbi:MAG: lysylphosphatidylglycerol synthase domain-containing protein [Gemmatimonadales bacterium]|nr:lysylphosphatidylglycerol synthase domain-containing protein [Gemmatimonadales bacterium]
MTLTGMGARAWRMRLLYRALGHPVGWQAALVANTWGEAAAALTPARLGGEPARLAGFLRAGVPATAAFVGLAIEAVAEWPLIALLSMAVLLRHGGDWWAHVRARAAGGLAAFWPWLVAVGAVTLVAWLAVRGRARPGERHVRRPLRRLRVYLRRLSPATLAATAPLTLVSLAGRLLPLPFLLATLPHEPAIGPALVGTIVLTYGQLVLPTPAGAGAVDLGFLAGAAGDVGDSGPSLLAWWRAYTIGVGVVAGAAFALAAYGPGVIRRVAGAGRSRRA